MLKGIIDQRGLKQRAVAERAKLKGPHLSKILSKRDVSTDELEKIARALDLKPGDLMENSCGDLSKVLPLVDVLRKFDDDAIPHVMAMLEAMRSVANKQNIYGRTELQGSEVALPSTTPKEPNSNADVNEEYEEPLPRPAVASREDHGSAKAAAKAGRRGRHGSTARKAR